MTAPDRWSDYLDTGRPKKMRELQSDIGELADTESEIWLLTEGRWERNPERTAELRADAVALRAKIHKLFAELFP